MDEDMDRLVIAVRADTRGFAGDVASMKTALEQGVGGGAERAARTIETALGRAIRTGKFGFDDLKAVALKALADIAATAIRGGIASVTGGGSGATSLAGAAGSLLSAAIGLPGRATGGPVSPGAAYLVGERGPELFVPTTSGAVSPIGAGGGSREIKVSIAVSAPTGAAPEALAKSSRQVARAVSRALAEAQG